MGSPAQAGETFLPVRWRVDSGPQKVEVTVPWKLLEGKDLDCLCLSLQGGPQSHLVPHPHEVTGAPHPPPYAE